MGRCRRRSIGGGRGKRGLHETCRDKVDYGSVATAWSDAAYQSVKWNKLHTPYKCPLGNHYHLSTKHNVGDGSHVPPEWRELVMSFQQRKKSVRATFWHLLRKWVA